MVQDDAMMHKVRSTYGGGLGITSEIETEIG